MLQKLKDRKQSGFTIIEVMIVLAIAGLILVVVLVAIPQLQRNQRNNARQSNLSRVVTEVNNYSGNNNGRIPSSATDISSFSSRYLGGINVEDPTTGENLAVVYQTGVSGVPPLSDDAAVIVVNDNGTAGDTGDDFSEVTAGGGDLGAAYFQTSSECDGETIATGAGARSFAIWTVLEGGAIYCLDNR